MTLIKSISGIRGTIGGVPGDNLTPIDMVKFTAAFVKFVQRNGIERPRIVVGRDARLSGFLVNQVVCGTLQAMGADVLDIGLSTTPTTEIAVTGLKADAGIILTASHNPAQWNALKLLNNRGEFISAAEGAWLLDVAAKDDFEFVPIEKIGSYQQVEGWIDRHIQMVLDLPLVNREVIKAANFKVAVDAVNSTGGIAIPKMLRALGVDNILELNCEPTGKFAHTPEPLAQNLTDICRYVKEQDCDFGVVVDPDVDRLVFVKEDGELFGEEYTLVSIADYVLGCTPGNTVSNLSSTQALKIITQKHNGTYHAAAVGEVNVVEKMKECHAVIGGEGNGGVIYPDLHYGRDALVGIALFLTAIATKKMTCSQYRSTFPDFYIHKDKIQLTPDINVDQVLKNIKQLYHQYNIIDIDGVKILFDNEWVHLRKSNTEPIIRIYAESINEATAKNMADRIKKDILNCIG